MNEKVILAQPRGGDRNDAEKFPSSYVAYQEGRLDGSYEVPLQPRHTSLATLGCGSLRAVFSD